MQLSSDWFNAPLYTTSFKGEEMHAELPALLSRKRFGHIHSLFDNGINIAMGEELIFIGTTKNGRLPFGIHMEMEYLQRLRQSVRLHDIVVASMPELLLFRHPRYPLALDLSQAKRYQYKLRTEQYNSYLDLYHTDQMVEICRRWGISNGLDAIWGAVPAASPAQADSPNNLSIGVQFPLETLFDAIRIGEERSIEQHLRYYLGRGQGLTPSGDDILLGILAVQALTAAFHPSLLEQMDRILSTEQITTDVSKAYLKHALHGRFSDKVVAVLNAMMQKDVSHFQTAVVRLLQTGHSSGIDTAYGIANAVMALRRYKHVKTSCDCIGR
ncbi:MAG: DUF2877 domain-containing protein [Paenibacillus sp.]|nr:DUF2877 domain-containing protein [Paenibacillus sp.]